MQLEVYNIIKARLETISSLKEVALWNNQFERENENVSFDYPCAFIEFQSIEYTDYLQGRQRYEMDIIIHIGFESYKNEDTDILTLKQTVNGKLHMYSHSDARFETRILRRSEIQDFDHNNTQDYQIIYKITGTDFGVNTLPDTDATVNTIDVTVEPVITNTTIRTASPNIP